MTSPIILVVTSEVPIPSFLTGDVKTKLVYVDELIDGVAVESDSTEISLSLREPALPDRTAAIKEKVVRAVRTLVDGALEPEIKIFDDYYRTPVTYSRDPIPELLASHEIICEAEGVFAFGPLMSRLINAFESVILKIADTHQAREYRFPVLISPQFFERIKYFKNFPHSLCFATHLREDLDIIESFAASAHMENDGLKIPNGSLAKIQALLSPTVCHHLYLFLADRTLSDDSLVATAFGHCFRYESANMTTLERLWNFTMREIVFVGDAQHVQRGIKAVQQRMTETLVEMGFAFRVESATDPFFIGQFKAQSAFQSVFDLKKEVRARLPFKDSDVAIGSYNYHQDFFGRSLDIRRSDGRHAHTGCVGFGFERMAFAFVAQYGLDRREWPAMVRRLTER